MRLRAGLSSPAGWQACTAEARARLEDDHLLDAGLGAVEAAHGAIVALLVLVLHDAIAAAWGRGAVRVAAAVGAVVGRRAVVALFGSVADAVTARGNVELALVAAARAVGGVSDV